MSLKLLKCILGKGDKLPVTHRRAMPEVGKSPVDFSIRPVRAVGRNGRAAEKWCPRAAGRSAHPGTILGSVARKPGNPGGPQAATGPWNFRRLRDGLNAAVNRLRDRLGDSATEPQYIETVPGRGYRFIATLDSPPNGQTQPDNVVPIRPPEPEPPELRSTKPPWWKRKALIAVTVCIGIVAGLYPLIMPLIERLGGYMNCNT